MHHDQLSYLYRLFDEIPYIDVALLGTSKNWRQ